MQEELKMGLFGGPLVRWRMEVLWMPKKSSSWSKWQKELLFFVIGIVLIVKPCLVMMVGILCASENGDGDDGEEMTCLAFSHYPKSESQSERPPNEHIFFAISQHLGVKQGNVSIRGCWEFHRTAWGSLEGSEMSSCQSKSLVCLWCGLLSLLLMLLFLLFMLLGWEVSVC